MRLKRTWCGFLAAALLMAGLSVSASNVTTIQSQKSQNEKELKEIQSRIDKLEDQKNALSSELNSLNDELVYTLMSIEVMENDLEVKEEQIVQAQADFEEAQATEDRQYESMKKRIQYLYEAGSNDYLTMLLTSDSIADLMNKVDYAAELQEYDRRLLEEYQAAKQAVVELQQTLEEEKEELLVIEEQLKEEKENMEVMIAQKENEIADFNSQLKSAKAKASEYQKKIKEQNSQIKKLQAEAAKAAPSNKGSSGSTPTVSGGSGTGASIASYGLQFVGRPYVFGGNSLTSGTDCSGFVNLIHSHFGISTPRTSGSLAAGGRAVSDADKMPGDVVCYPKHVGIYIGNNQIVHASSERTGIKVSNMYYRSVLCIRRYW